MDPQSFRLNKGPAGGPSKDPAKEVLTTRGPPRLVFHTGRSKGHTLAQDTGSKPELLPGGKVIDENDLILL